MQSYISLRPSASYAILILPSICSLAIYYQLVRYNRERDGNTAKAIVNAIVKS